ncbi:MAG: hypothetical protein GY757_37565 [bacterium]|nr:hypothetical protein [bacterium]
MKNHIDELKRIDLVDFLSRNYGLEFRFTNNEYVGHSPFSEDKTPSFFVRRADDGHWIFKCFSSGHGGTIIDFILIKERLVDVRDAIEFIDGRIGSPVLRNEYYGASELRTQENTDNGSTNKCYDVAYLYEVIRERGHHGKSRIPDWARDIQGRG